MSFRTSDIVSTPVLTQVYDANELDRYLSFEDFKTSVFILQSNRELDIVSSQYQAKLADTKLTPVDRERIESEFRNKLSSLPDSSLFPDRGAWVGASRRAGGEPGRETGAG